VLNVNRWKWSAVLGWSVVGVGLLMGADDAGETRLKRLIIEDDAGRERISLEMVGDQPTIAMSDARGNLRLLMCLGEGGEPSIRLNDAKNKRRVLLHVWDKYPPEVTIEEVTADRKTESRSLAFPWRESKGAAPAEAIRTKSSRTTIPNAPRP
jgi:hypothetical protein